MEGVKEGLGPRLRRLREERGWSIENLATFSGVPGGTIKIIEEGRTKDPRITTVVRLAWALGRTLDDVVGGVAGLWNFVDDAPLGLEMPAPRPVRKRGGQLVPSVSVGPETRAASSSALRPAA